MPIYEYRCQSCDHRFELLVRRETVPTCPKCGAREPEKQLSAFAINTPLASLPASGCAGCPSAGDPAACASHLDD